MPADDVTANGARHAEIRLRPNVEQNGEGRRVFGRLGWNDGKTRASLHPIDRLARWPSVGGARWKRRTIRCQRADRERNFPPSTPNTSRGGAWIFQ